MKNTQKDLLVALYLLVFPQCILADPSGVTTIDATSCASPSCTVTPTLITSLTITPTPVTVLHAPGAITPVVVSFHPITIASLQPETTVLANTGDGVLSLGSTTFSGLKATATTSYLVIPSDAADAPDLFLDVAVVADVRAEAQLFFGFNNDDGAACQLFPEAGLSKRSLYSSRSLRRGLNKRVANTQDVSVAKGEKAWITAAVLDAAAVIDAVVTRFEKGPIVKQINDIGFNEYFKQKDFDKLFQMAQAMKNALDSDNKDIEVIFTTLNTHPAEKAEACPKSETLASTKNTNVFPEVAASDPPCQIQGYTVICQKSLDANFGLPQNPMNPDGVGNGDGPTKDEFCTAENKLLMFNPATNARWFDYSKNAGSRARVILHELTHYKTVCQAAGFPPQAPPRKGPPPADLRDFCNSPKSPLPAPNREKYPIARLDNDGHPIGVNNIPVRTQRGTGSNYLINAENYALSFIGWYLREVCGWNDPATINNPPPADNPTTS